MTMFLTGPEQDALQKMLARKSKIVPVPAPIINQYGLEPSASVSNRLSAEANNRIYTPGPNGTTPLEQLQAGYGTGQPHGANGFQKQVGTSVLPGQDNVALSPADAVSPRPTRAQAIQRIHDRANPPADQTPYVQAGYGLTSEPHKPGQSTHAQQMSALDTPVDVNFSSDQASDPAAVGGVDASGAQIPDGQIYRTTDGIHFRNDAKAKLQVPVVRDVGRRQWQPRDLALQQMARRDPSLGKQVRTLDSERQAIMSSPTLRPEEKRQMLRQNDQKRNTLAAGASTSPEQPKPQSMEDLGAIAVPGGGGWMLQKANGDWQHIPAPKAEKSAAGAAPQSGNAEDIAMKVTSEHPDWTEEQQVAEVKKRLGQ